MAVSDGHWPERARHYRAVRGGFHPAAPSVQQPVVLSIRGCQPRSKARPDRRTECVRLPSEDRKSVPLLSLISPFSFLFW